MKEWGILPPENCAACVGFAFDTEGCPDVYFRDRNLIAFLRNLMRKPLSVSWEYPGTFGRSVEGILWFAGGLPTPWHLFCQEATNHDDSEHQA